MNIKFATDDCILGNYVYLPNNYIIGLSYRVFLLSKKTGKTCNNETNKNITFCLFLFNVWYRVLRLRILWSTKMPNPPIFVRFLIIVICFLIGSNKATDLGLLFFEYLGRTLFFNTLILSTME